MKTNSLNQKNILRFPNIEAKKPSVENENVLKNKFWLARKRIWSKILDTKLPIDRSNMKIDKF